MSEHKAGKTYSYRYQFTFENGTEKDFEIMLKADTMELVANKDLPKPEWTRLNYHQCENCPLGDDVEYCPVAVNLSGLVEAFKDSISFERTTIKVIDERRSYEAQATLQEGLSSIIGIFMVTSNCPIMDQLRPIARFHLPVASEEETIYQAISMYLTEQYFRMRYGEEPDWKLKHLVEIYRDISVVNQGMSERLRAASNKDANVNAVIHLSSSSQSLDNFLDYCLKEIEYLFPQKKRW